MTAYYNENDAFAAQWLRNLIEAGHIAPGDVDDRSIEDVVPSDLNSYTQCHFFAGIGVWSLALRNAGWPDDRPVWTGSCPCQPFSAAGKGAGFDDERHLWPSWFHLVQQCAPPIVFGEQVASKDGLGWLDLVQADLEGAGYAVGAADMCAAGVGAPHIRQRLWFVAERLAHAESDGRVERRAKPNGRCAERGRGADRLADADSRQRERLTDGEGCQPDRQTTGRQQGDGIAQSGGDDGRLADADQQDQGGRGIQRPGEGDSAGDGATRERPAGLRADGRLGHHHHPGLEGHGRPGKLDGPQGREAAPRHGSEAGMVERVANTDSKDATQISESHDALDKQRSQDGRRSVVAAGVGTGGGDERWNPFTRSGEVGASKDMARLDRPGPVNGVWRDADWLFCRDGKWRPVESGTFPLVDGTTARVGRLRAYGNAIAAPVAEEFVKTVMDYRKREAILNELV